MRGISQRRRRHCRHVLQRVERGPSAARVVAGAGAAVVVVAALVAVLDAAI